MFGNEDYHLMIKATNKRVAKLESTVKRLEKLLETTASDHIDSIGHRYFIVGYRCRLNGGVAVGSINMETESTYLNRVEATKIIDDNNIGAKDIVITSVNELSKDDYCEWMGF